MKTKLLLFLLLLLPMITVAQKQPRRVLTGRVVADSLKVENLTVRNLTSNISAVTDEAGDFSIYARATDTLLFSGITVHRAMLVLKPEHFLESKILVKLNVEVTVLKEVIITPNVLTGVLDSDSRKIKTKNLTGGMDSGTIIAADPTLRPKANPNTALPSNVVGSQLNGVNFTEVYKMIFKKRKRKDKGQIYAADSGKTFSENVKERFTHHFFTKMLEIPNDEIGLFLAFCDKGEETAWMLDPKYEFELTDYLVAQSSVYLKKDK